MLKRQIVGRVAAIATMALLGLLAPPLAAAAPVGAAGIYTQHTAQSQDCWAVDGQLPTPTTQCRSYGAPIQTGLPSDVQLQGDFCMNYGLGALAMDQSTTDNLSAFFGFEVPSSTFEKVDPVTGSGCAITGHSSRWGMVLQGSASNGFCVPTNCGIMHLLNWTSTSVRPFVHGHSLIYGARFGVITDTVGAYIPQAVWHGYLCPALEDTSTAQGLLLCQETWRSDSGQNAYCHETSQFLGFGICLTNSSVTAVLAPDGGSGFREFVEPAPGTNYTMVWTRPQAGTLLSTSTGASFRGANQFGMQTYGVSVDPQQMRQVIAMYNFALSIDQHNGVDPTAKPMSSVLSDWALTSLQVGIEGNALNGASAVMIGAASSGLYAGSR